MIALERAKINVRRKRDVGTRISERCVTLSEEKRGHSGPVRPGWTLRQLDGNIALPRPTGGGFGHVDGWTS